jgi:hypothetical protein
MYNGNKGPIFKDIFEIIEYFHKNMQSHLKLDICCSTGLTDPPVWVWELVACDDKNHDNDATICVIDEREKSEAIKFLRELNRRQEAN